MTRRQRRVARIVLACLAIALVALAGYVVYLDRIVTPRFEGRRWTLPAKVYAQPLELYAGLPLTPDALVQELERLHYRRADELTRPGTYRRRGDRFDIAARRVRFEDELREAQTLRVRLQGGHVARLADARGREVPIFRLDPLLIGSLFPSHGEDRIVVAPGEVPPLLTAALVATEDRKFRTHHGIDLEGILRAAWANLRAGRIEQGGSTLTQQLVKSYFLDDRQTYGRKFKEALMAMILEARFEKDDLMNAYINEIYLGQDGPRAVHGFGLASRFYFGKPLGELELHEMALLVAMVRGPSYYDPRTRPDRARQRRDLVLRVMAERNVITAEQAKRAMAAPLKVTTHGDGGYYPAYLDFVRRTLRRDYADADLTEAGLQIFTSLDPRVQALAERTLAQELERLDRTRREKGAQLEGAVVVTEPQSGDVIAIVGGRNAGYRGFNRALDSARSIGSLAKPIVYLAALETGRYSAASLIPDEPIEVRLSSRRVWRPENFTHEYAGPVPLVRALAESRNLATVHLGLEVGLPKIMRTFQRLGLEKPPAGNPSLILGGGLDLSPLQVAQIYNSLANGGFRTPLRAVRAVVSADGKPLKAFSLEVTPVTDPKIVFQLDRMLVLAVEHGTGRAARARLPPDIVVAGKTGTSSDFRDSWFAGFSGSHLAVVWVGYDDNRPTGLTGTAGALAVWANLFGRLGTSPFDRLMPEGLEARTIEFDTGLEARVDCADEVVMVPLPEGTELTPKPGCGENPFRSLADRARRWWENVTER